MRARFAGGGVFDVSTAMSSLPSLFVAEIIVARTRVRASHGVGWYRARGGVWLCVYYKSSLSSRVRVRFEARLPSAFSAFCNAATASSSDALRAKYVRTNSSAWDGCASNSLIKRDKSLEYCRDICRDNPRVRGVPGAPSGGIDANNF
jgi:hypothetical protein